MTGQPALRSGPPAQTGWHALTPDESLELLGASRHGLTASEAAARLAKHGRNELESAEGVSALSILVRQVRSPLIYILLVALAVTLAVGEWTDSIAIGAVVILNTVIGFFQEYRAENSVAALLQLAAPRAVVIRDGWPHDIEAALVVPGDIVEVEAGSRVPADLRLLTTTGLRMDESLLTGEPEASVKTTEKLSLPGAVITADMTNMAFMGTTVSAGRGAGVVVATGAGTEFGGIAKGLKETGQAQLPLERRLARLGKVIAVGTLVASAITFGLGLALGEPLVEMFITTVALTVSAIPEGLPVAMTIALAVGVRRMARRNAIVRRPVAVETLGSCTVILSDKTGTLTENRMTVRKILAGGQEYDVHGPGDGIEGQITDGTGGAVSTGALPPALEAVLAAGVLASDASLWLDTGRVITHGDPTEVALSIAAAKAGISKELLLENSPQTGAVPFSSESPYQASLHRGGQPFAIFVKGSPEHVIGMCDREMAEGGQAVALDRAAVLQKVQSLSRQGLRVLAMAVGDAEIERSHQSGIAPSGLIFAGLQAMLDPPRTEAADAIKGCHRAGIRVLMVTGDHAATAQAIASQLGLDRRASAPVLTGADLEGMTDEEVSERLKDVLIFARVSPAQKHRLVRLLNQQGEVTAVTGDGVNDAPALKEAHIGVAMGQSGTDVAKEASDIVATDDNFASVYSAVQEGRTAFANIRNVTYFVVVTGVSEVLAILSSLVFGMPIPLLPAQILWMNVVTESSQLAALAVEPGEEEQYERDPRPAKEGVLSRILYERLVLVGIVMAAGTVGVFALERAGGQDLGYARSAALTALVMFQLFIVGSSRSEARSVLTKSPFSNPWLFAGVLIALSLHLAALYSPPGREILRLEPISLESWARLTAIAASGLLVAEGHKFFRGRIWVPGGPRPSHAGAS